MNRKGLSLVLATLLALILLPALFSILGRAQTAYAATFIVNISFDENDGVCDSSCSIRDAIFVAGDGDDITIPAGSYTLSATNGSLIVTENIIFNGNSATDTFIDAMGSSSVISVTAGTVIFNNLTLQNGAAMEGAGMHISGGATNVTLSNSVVVSNNATTDGGGLFVQSGVLTLQDSEVVTNTAVSDGGGIYLNRGTLTVDNSNVNFNVSDRAGGIFVNDDTASATLNSGEISFNTANIISDTFSGGGIYVAAGSAIINGGVISGNAAFRGGGILVNSGEATINGGQIIDNESNYGGGIYVREASGLLTINDGEISQNRSIANVFGGGALYIFQGSIIMNGGVISANTAVNDGGALEIGDPAGRFTLNAGEMSNNNAGSMGGALYIDGGTLTVTGGMIVGNNSFAGGGGIALDMGSDATIENSAILSNTTAGTNTGGGIINAGTLTMSNVTLSGNSAFSGAGLANSGTAVLNNVTLSENSASSSGGGLSNSGGTLTVGNSIIFGNSAPSNANCNGTITSIGNNVADAAQCNGEIAANPQLQPLALNGGDTLNYALGAVSSAIDAGNNATCAAADQRGNLRPINGTCDIGAYENGIGFFISDASLTEGDAGSTQMSFIVSRSFITDTTYTVDYVTMDGTALAGSDYTAVSATTLTFLSSEMTQTVQIDILGDLLDEDDEIFTVQLGNQSIEVGVGDHTGAATILDDDAQPSLTIDDLTVMEGGTAVFTATLSAASGKTITVDYDTMDGTAVAGADYTTNNNTLTFTPGTLTQTISINVSGDLIDEFDETFTVELSNESNVTLADSSGQATITDDDAEPTLTIGDVSVTEGDSGTTIANFLVTLSAASGKTITVDYMTNADTATAGTDYLIASNTLTFTPGSDSEIINVTVNGDIVDEFNETFQVNLNNENNVIVTDGSAVGTISDDDPLPIVTINDVIVTEGDSGTVTAVFTVMISAASEKTITINYSSSDGSATAGEDYTAVPASVLTFNPGGSLSQTISVMVNGDEDSEENEQFFINLTGSANATLGNSQAVGTISNDDGFTLYLPFIITP
ncbi:hypothetical protein MNBD_CHLOROFLEXI01-4317 [hydrothermal vent metagenome]|uniref:Calx-beta domain-containing protein n=1 Tax=hydrothermal vent metagenome TaxID=652676 RepID=A0A3B0VNR1_9ZZZZ